MQRHGLARFLVLAAALIALPALALALEEQSLLTADGTLHVLRSGRVVDLGIQDATLSPEDVVIEWVSRAQDGTLSAGVIPGTVSRGAKRGLQAAFDEQTHALLLLWTEDISAFSQIRVGVLHDGVWTNSGLLPNQGISRAFNPQMRVTHQSVSYLDEHDTPISKTSSILSILWWEEAQYGQARLATLFLDENAFDPASLSMYDLPVLTGGGGEVSYDDIPPGAYLFPSLQADGLSGGLLVSYADLHDQRHKVVRVQFPDDHGKPSEAGNLKWQRRHIPIVGIASSGPIARTPTMTINADAEISVGTSIGSGYLPTLYWRDGDFLKYSRLEGADWAPVRSIAIDAAMTYEKALELVTGMGARQ